MTEEVRINRTKPEPYHMGPAVYSRDRNATADNTAKTYTCLVNQRASHGQVLHQIQCVRRVDREI